MRARRSGFTLAAALAATTLTFGAAPVGAIVDGQAIAAGDLAPGGAWGFLTDVDSTLNGECSGSLVTQRWVLTAAHCVGGSMFVRVGSSADAIAVTGQVVHPQYVLDGPNGPQFDVALLQLASSVAIPPASLPAADAALVPTGTTVEIAGFGSTSATTSTGTGVARSGSAVVQSSTSGLLLLGASPSSVGAGDSGGPTLVDGVLVGVHSFSVPGDPSSPTGDMPVAPLVTWIRSVVDGAGRAPQVTSGELQTPIDTPIEFPVQITDEQPVSIATQVTFTPTNGTVSNCASDTPPTTCLFTPAAGFEGFAGVLIEATDGTSTGSGGWSIVVGDPTPPPPNQRPVITSLRQISTGPGLPVDFELGFSDPDGTVLDLDDATLSVASGGTVSCTGTTSPFVCTFVPNAGFVGRTTIRVTLTDGIDEAIRSISVSVVAGGLPPTATDLSLDVEAGDDFTVAFVADDDLLGPLGAEHIVASEDSLSSTVRLVSCDIVSVPSTCTYSTEPGRAGSASFSTTFSDGFNEVTQLIEVRVLAGGAAPVVSSPVSGTQFDAMERSTLSIPVAAIDPEGGEISVRYSSNFAGDFCVERDANGRIVCSLELPLGTAGIQPVTLYVVDAAGNTTSVDVTIDVAPFVGNLAPTAQLSLEAPAAPVTGDLVTARVVVDDPEGAAASCQIAWGDGTTSTVTAVGSTCVATHRYTVAGAMDVVATATDAEAATSEPTSSRIDITNRRARLEGEVSWRVAGAQHRLKVEATPRSGEVEFRLPDGRRLDGRVSTMQVFGNVAEVRGTGKLGRQNVSFVLLVVDGGRGRTAVDTASIAILDSAGNVIVSVDSPSLNGLTIR